MGARCGHGRPNGAIKLERLLAAFARYNASETTAVVTC